MLAGSKNRVLPLGWRHSVEPRFLSPQTREKVCVWCVFDILQRLCFSIGCRHSVEPRSPLRQTLEKVCVWCVCESHTHSVSAQKGSQRN